MSWIDLGLRALEYGPSIIVLIFIILLARPGYKWVNFVNNNQKNIQAQLKICEDNMDHVHEGCHIPEGAIKKIQEDIRVLQEKDNTIEIKLTDMNNVLTQTHTMTTAMYNHFFEEGINRGRRGND